MDTFKELMEIIKRLKTRIRNLESLESDGIFWGFVLVDGGASPSELVLDGNEIILTKEAI